MNESMNAATQNIHWLENSLLASEFAGKGRFMRKTNGADRQHDDRIEKVRS